MSIKKALKTKIESVTQAASAGLKVYYGIAPQQAGYPYAILNRIGGYAFGDQGGDECASREVFQLDLYHDDDEGMEIIRNAIISAINAQGRVTWSSIVVHSCTIDSVQDLTELETEGNEEGAVRQMIEIVIVYNR